MSGQFLANLLLAVAWGAVTGDFSEPNLLFGFALAFAALWLIREQFGTSKYYRRLFLVTGLIWLFLKELVMSAVRVFLVVVSPRMVIRPGIVAYPLTVTSDTEITLLANLITLTPGTLSVDVSDDRRTLYIHCVDVDDVEALRQSIADGFEAKIMEALR